MAPPKLWYIPANFDIPSDGFVELGNMIADHDMPDYPVNRTAPPKIERTSYHKAGPWHFQQGKERSIAGGISTDFLSIFGVGVDFTVHFSKEQSRKLDGKLIETITFQPDRTYIEQALGEENVKEWIQSHGRWRPLYIIDGIKRATETSETRMETTERGVQGQTTVNIGVLAAGVPLEIGPHIDISNKQSTEISSENSDTFIFAYRMQKIKLRRHDKFTMKPNKGGLFGHEDEQRDEDSFEFDVENLTAVDQGDPITGKYEADADGGLCEVVLLT